MANDRILNYVVKLNDQFSAGQKKVAGSMREMSTESKTMAIALKDVGIGLASLSAAALAANALRAPIRAASEMQQSLLGVKAELIGTGKTMQAVNRELSLVQQNALAVQSATAFSASEIIDLQKELLKGGASLSQIAGENGAAMASALLAQYEGVMASYAGQGLIAIATPFNLAGDQFAYLADQITRASAASTGGFVDFAEGAKYAAPQLSALGVAMEDMLIMQAMLAQGGLQGSMGGTALAALFSEASASGNFTSATLKSPQALIEQLRSATAGKDEVGAQNALRDLGFGDRSMKAVLSLINQDFEAMNAKMAESAGLTDKIAVTMSGLNAQMGSLASSVQSVAGLAFQPALEPLSGFVSLLNSAVSSLGELVAKYPALAKITSAGAGIGVAGLGLYGGLRTLRGVSIAGGGLRAAAGQAGRNFLSGGAGGLLKGVTQGKALEAAAGVQSVYVVNQLDEKKLAMATSGGDMMGMQMGRLTGSLSGLMRLVPIIGALGLGITTLLSIAQQDSAAAEAERVRKDSNLNYQLALADQEITNTPHSKAIARGRTIQGLHQQAANRDATLSEATVLTGLQADVLRTLTPTIRDAFSKATDEGMNLPLYHQANFAMDYKRLGSKIWEDPQLSKDYADIYPLLQNDKATEINLNIEMKQQQTPTGIQNKEFIVNVASGARAKTTAIRGENLKSISRNV